ncbi:succinate-semialdehyde dehydrogenase [Virgisporangium aliadipatigenens]|uniref:Succinate-semialdehyde dehydrogenase n=1 Tax=Virgisporangium aliadipatigenens TaxID=741659 RepID=A0A8J4DQE1_9ACTN|nr:aldehyde dehydrogenase family protein [Virgisporangium aliadipatigenens]GIJ46945.1 succinate-semialdehyde dehydrogenase [Virgisporangium aliadipatigenens]
MDIESQVREAWSAAPSAAPKGVRIPILDPADGAALFTLPVGSAADVADAVRAARSAFDTWRTTPAAQRGARLRDAADAVAARADDLARLTMREMGKPFGDALGGVEAGVGTLRQYAELGPLRGGRALNGSAGAADLMIFEPRGLVAALTPWNDPVAVACGLIGAAVVTGNTVVHKPSERAPATGWLLGELIREHVPVWTVLGDATTGRALIANDPDVVAHVGSSATGEWIRAHARGKVLLENGGNDPLVVDAGVDPVWAAEQAALGAFANAGQICVSIERIYAHEAVAEPFLDALVARARAFEIGPLVDRRMRDAVHGQVRDAVEKGARVLCGGEVPAGPGSFYPPTVLAGCTDDMAVLTEETFGPVAPVRVVGSFDEGLRLAAGGRYGLAASVLTRDMGHAQRAWRELPVGTVKINAVFGGAPGGAAHPRGASGQGYGYGPELLDEFTYTKAVHVTAI